MPSERLASVLFSILATDDFEATKDSVARRPAVQRAVLELALHALSLPREARAELATDIHRCAALQELAEAASADCLADARRAAISGGSASGGSASLLSAVASLAGCPELQAQRSSPCQGGLLMACLELQAVLHRDRLDAQQGDRVQTLSAEQLKALGSRGGLPLLCLLAADVAAAAPTRSGGGGGEGSDGLGAWCWRETADDWQVGLLLAGLCCLILRSLRCLWLGCGLLGAHSPWTVFWGRAMATALLSPLPADPHLLQVCLHRWRLVLGAILTGDAQPRGSDLQSGLATWRAAEALLRLLSALPAQPAIRRRSGQWCTVVEVVAGQGGLAAMRASDGLRELDGPVLALGALHIAKNMLLEGPLPVEALASREAAQAAFGLLSSACRAVHAAAPGLAPGGDVGTGEKSLLLVRNDIADLQRLLVGAAGLALATGTGVLHALTDAAERAAAERCVPVQLCYPKQPLHPWRALQFSCLTHHMLPASAVRSRPPPLPPRQAPGVRHAALHVSPG